MTQYIAVGKLAALYYCPYKLYLAYHKPKNIPKPTPYMIQGAKAHKKLYDKHKEEIKIIKESGVKPDIDINREVSVRGERVKGRIDEIQVGDDYIRIIDDKPRDTAYDSDKVQVWAYCLAYKQQHNYDGKLLAAVRDYKRSVIIWEETYTNRSESIVLDCISQIDDIIAGNEPKSTTNSMKCSKCNMRTFCDRKVENINIEEFLQKGACNNGSKNEELEQSI